MGHTGRQRTRKHHQQTHFEEFPPWRFRLQHGGVLRQKRLGRKARPISTRAPLHLVFKADKLALRRGLRSPLCFAITNRIIKTFSKRFFVKLEQYSINHDHIHLVIRVSRRSLHHYFLRVVAGQIAQEFKKEGLLRIVTDTPLAKGQGGVATVKSLARATKTRPLWKHRPFTRIVKGWRGFKTVMNYVRLNEKEARGDIPYRKTRLRGLSTAEWELLWR